ncbi:MAG: hypothetical protein N2Z79_04305 [Candidatus Omnitrophica bacterium]|nr:hypothetical protein [Candidatus Omnitrophota bacterium]
MESKFYKEISKDRWFTLSFAEQMAHLGSEISRANRWKDKDTLVFWRTVERALELFYLVIKDKRWKNRLKEISRLKELFCDAVLGAKDYKTTLADLERYFYYFNFYLNKDK